MSRREQLLQALLAVLNTVEDIEIVERNRTTLLPDGTKTALILLDGSVEGQTGRDDWRREPVFRMELTPEVYGWAVSSDTKIGTLRDGIISRTVEAVWRDETLRGLLDEFEGDLVIDGIDCFLPKVSASRTAGQFIIGFRIGFVFDPANP